MLFLIRFPPPVPFPSCFFHPFADSFIRRVQHPFSGKGKPKNVTVNFISRKGAMQLSWGGKSGVPLETIFGVTKGINTDVSALFVNCFCVRATCSC